MTELTELQKGAVILGEKKKNETLCVGNRFGRKLLSLCGAWKEDEEASLECRHI